MRYDIQIPSVGESVREAMISKWTKHSGETVHSNEVVLVLETDKANTEVVAEHDGTLTTLISEGEVAPIGLTVGFIESEPTHTTAPNPQPPTNGTPPLSSEPIPPITPPATSSPPVELPVTPPNGGTAPNPPLLHPSPSSSTLLRLAEPAVTKHPIAENRTLEGSEEVSTLRGRRVPMTMIRRRIAERLVAAQHTAAQLTTFNEFDMTQLQSMREKYREAFKNKHGIGLGLTSFFVKAVVQALRAVPEINGRIEGTDILYFDQFDIGVAVDSPRGLVVPVLRNADELSFAEIEMKIKEFGTSAKEGKIHLEDLMGGTFTISNGGIFGSLLSTPILNFPQSGILGLHKINERPIAINGKIEIRPMMYAALSYDHRLIDGSKAVRFLVCVKEAIEEPGRLLLEV